MWCRIWMSSLTETYWSQSRNSPLLLEVILIHPEGEHEYLKLSSTSIYYTYYICFSVDRGAWAAFSLLPAAWRRNDGGPRWRSPLVLPFFWNTMWTSCVEAAPLPVRRSSAPPRTGELRAQTLLFQSASKSVSTPANERNRCRERRSFRGENWVFDGGEEVPLPG